jgi:hypothetical protein
MLLTIFSVLWLGCSDETDLVVCEGGACETQQECVRECEDVCGDPDYGPYDCIDGNCECLCFFGCK